MVKKILKRFESKNCERLNTIFLRTIKVIEKKIINSILK